MGSGRDKRKKKNPKPGRGAEKTAQKTEKAELKRERRAMKAAEGDEDDIDAILALVKLDAGNSSDVVVRQGVPPPSQRVNCSLTAFSSPSVRGGHELLMFGGEYFNNNKTAVYQDFYRYNPQQDAWAAVLSPNTPPPRSAHQAFVTQGCLYIFGGEFTSPNQERFRHYKDLWRCDLATNEWEQLPLKGGPSPRSGHRMAVIKQTKVLLFGGFFDTGKDVQYYNDLYLLDLSELTWTSLGAPSDDRPSPRSACQLAVHGEHLYLYGGYYKVQDDEVRDLEKGRPLSDLWRLSLLTFQWEKLKKQGMAPGPRAGFSLAVHKKRAVLFGGAVDHEKDRAEVIVSEFYNETYTFAFDNHRWFPLMLRGSPGAKKKKDPGEDAQRPEDGPLQADAVLRAFGKNVGAGADEGAAKARLEKAATVIQANYRGYAVRKAIRVYKIGGLVSELLYSPATGLAPKDDPRPIGRMNAAMTVVGNTLWLFGGMIEMGDDEVTLDDMWTLDLNKQTHWVCVKPLTALPQEGYVSSDGGEWEEAGSDDADEDSDQDVDEA